MANSRIVNGPMQVIPQSGTTARSVTLTTTAANFILSPALNDQTTHVWWTLDGCDARIMIVGTTPTTSTGHLIYNGSSGIWSKIWATSAKIVATSGTGVVTISELNHT